MDTKMVLRPATVTALLLLLPYFAMKFGWKFPDPGSSPEVPNWNGSDFVIMGILLFGAGFLIELVLRSTNKYRAAAIIAVVFGFLWLWAELAVGVFTTWGS